MAAPVVLPRIRQQPTAAKGSRNGADVRLVVVHRWGARNVDVPGSTELKSYQGVISEFLAPANQASAHFVGPVRKAGTWEVTQMVPYAERAWTESTYSPVCVEIETPDSLWVGARRGVDLEGLHVTARIVAFLLHHFGLPPHWMTATLAPHGRGFCRHADLGAAGGGHTVCPTADLPLWHLFCGMVALEAHRGGFRPTWGE